MAAQRTGTGARAGSRAGGSKAKGAVRNVAWSEARVAPVVVVTGTEQLLAERAVARVVALRRLDDPSVEVVTVDAVADEAGRLQTAVSPSLFDEPRVVVVTGVEAAAEAVEKDVVAHLAALASQPDDEVVLVLRHGGGQRKKVLDAARAVPGALSVDCPPLKKDAEKIAFVGAELETARRRISAPAARALVDAVGSDLRELAAACAQLVADTSGTVEPEDVQRYHGGRVEATSFRVADAVVTGSAAEALAMLRQALATGVEPVLVVAALAMRLRQMALVAGSRGRDEEVARALGMQPWMVGMRRRELRGWSATALGAGLVALAATDADVKGGGRDPVYALERAVLALCGSREP